MDIQSLYQRWYDNMLTDAFNIDKPQLVSFDAFRNSFLREADLLLDDGINPDTLTVDDIVDDYHNDVFTPSEYVFILQHFLAS